MADSSLGGPSHDSILCDLCQEHSINWTCIDYEMCFCEKCKTFHLKVPATAQHQIIAGSTPIKDVRKTIVTNNIPCQCHKTKVMCLFCRNCECLVCADCVSMEHPKHQFVSIETVLNEKLDHIKKLGTKMSDNFKMCEAKIKQTKYLKPKYNSVLDDSIAKIKQREHELKDAISNYSRLLQNEIESERSMVDTIVSQIEQETNEAKRKLEDQNYTVETILTSNQGRVIFEAPVQFPDIVVDPLPDMIKQFNPEEDETPEQLQKLFGSLQKGAIKQGFDFRVLKSFTSDHVGIRSIRVLSGETESNIWISYPRKHVISFNSSFVFEEDDESKEDTMTFSGNSFDLEAYDMSLTPDNDVLLADWNSSDVKLLSKSGDVKPFLSVTPLIARSVHVTKDNIVMVGVTESMFELITNNRQGAIIIFAADGTQKYRLEYDENERGLFTFPYRIKTNYNQNIVVIDRLLDKIGRVVTLDSEGHLKWVYEGHPEINAIIKFDPRDIVTTSEGQIIVSDNKTHSLHVLFEDGEVFFVKL